MSTEALCEAVESGDIAALAGLLDEADAAALNAFDRNGFTPLMQAARSAAAPAEMVQMLLRRGADPMQTSSAPYNPGCSVLALALGAGDPRKVALLLGAGADLHYERGSYGALIDAVHDRDVAADPRLLELLELLIARGADLDAVSSHNESALRVLSRLGRFDAVARLLASGAAEVQLAWTPLIRAVALGDLADVKSALDGRADLEARDYWGRSAWLVAVLTGSIEKADLLRAHGADVEAGGRCGQPAVFYAIAARSEVMLRWLLELGAAPDSRDDSGCTALMTAAERGNVAALDLLLAAGAAVDADNAERSGMTALWYAADAATARCLLAAGADPQHLQFEQRRALLGLRPEPDVRLLRVSAAEFEQGRRRRFGSANPEPMSDPFWLAMLRSGVTGYAAADRFGLTHAWNDHAQPVWCAQRFGQSLTFLPDGRIVQVGGEHEDGYDPDFCIYNDVFVHEPDGSLRIYGYPEAEFPPTDFHTATQVGDQLWLIGSLGYAGSRRYGETQVHCLDLHSFRISRVSTTGQNPGWIYRHRAELHSPTRIRIHGGEVASRQGDAETYVSNAAVFELDLRRASWQRLD